MLCSASSRAPEKHALNTTTPGGCCRIMQASQSAPTGPSARSSRPGAPWPDQMITSHSQRSRAATPARVAVSPPHTASSTPSTPAIAVSSSTQPNRGTPSASGATSNTRNVIRLPPQHRKTQDPRDTTPRNAT